MNYFVNLTLSEQITIHVGTCGALPPPSGRKGPYCLFEAITVSRMWYHKGHGYERVRFCQTCCRDTLDRLRPAFRACRCSECRKDEIV